MFSHMGEWVIESLQGAWVREYHQWEKATKAYFDGHHVRNGGKAVNWPGKIAEVQRPSHLHHVAAQLAQFQVAVSSDVLDAINGTRNRVNVAKHQADHFVTEADYKAFLKTIRAFWEQLSGQEEFTPPRRQER